MEHEALKRMCIVQGNVIMRQSDLVNILPTQIWFTKVSMIDFICN